jgi:hypothetical protein
MRLESGWEGRWRPLRWPDVSMSVEINGRFSPIFGRGRRLHLVDRGDANSPLVAPERQGELASCDARMGSDENSKVFLSAMVGHGRWNVSGMRGTVG